MAAPIIQKGTATLNANASSVAVTFGTAFPTSTVPVVVSHCQENKNLGNEWAHTISTTGFTHQVETVDATYSRTIGYIAFGYAGS